ncbi:MAG: hypothetical protein WBJ21_06065, partial [Burkholderiaceae bacterium]
LSKTFGAEMNQQYCPIIVDFFPTDSQSPSSSFTCWHEVDQLKYLTLYKPIFINWQLNIRQLSTTVRKIFRRATLT